MGNSAIGVVAALNDVNRCAEWDGSRRKKGQPGQERRAFPISFRPVRPTSENEAQVGNEVRGLSKEKQPARRCARNWHLDIRLYGVTQA
jgi:hypothetical protein